jgi:hypothetical protein
MERIVNPAESLGLMRSKASAPVAVYAYSNAGLSTSPCWYA